MTPHEEVFSRRGGVKMVLMELEQLREAVAQLKTALPAREYDTAAPRVLAVLKRRQVCCNCSAAAAGGCDDSFDAAANGSDAAGKGGHEDGSLPSQVQTGLLSNQLARLVPSGLAASDSRSPSECQKGGQEPEWSGSKMSISESQATVLQHTLLPGDSERSSQQPAVLLPAMAGRSWAPVQVGRDGTTQASADRLQARSLSVVGRSALLPLIRPTDLPDAGRSGPPKQRIPGGWNSGPATSGPWDSESQRKRRVSRRVQSDQDVVLVRASRPPGPVPRRSSAGAHPISRGGELEDGGGEGGGRDHSARGRVFSMAPETAVLLTGKIRPASPISLSWSAQHARYERQLDRLLAEVVGQAPDPLGRGTPGWPGTSA